MTLIKTTLSYIDKSPNQYRGNYAYFIELLDSGEIKITERYTTKNNPTKKLEKVISTFRLKKGKKKGIMSFHIWANNNLASKDGIFDDYIIKRKYVYHSTIEKIEQMINNIKHNSEIQNIYNQVNEDIQKTDYWNC